MRLAVSVVLSLVAVTTIQGIGGIPLSPDSAIWHKISKRDTVAVAPSTTENNKNSSQSSPTQKEPKDSKTVLADSSARTKDELIETQPDSPLQEPLTVPDGSLSVDGDQLTFNSEKLAEDEGDASSDRSIDWQLLSGNPADLERELEVRRRRRSVRSSLSRQHRIRTVGRVQRSRSKRNVYYGISPSDLLAAYSYLEARRQEEEAEEAQPRLSLSGDVSDRDLSNLASLIYELQRAGDGTDEEDEGRQVPTGGYVDFGSSSNLEPEAVRITPEQLASLEQALSDRLTDDETGLYPKDKRSLVEPTSDDEVGPDQEDESEGEAEPVFLIPASMSPSSEYVQIPLAATYQNPYDFYQVDDNSGAYEEALRRLDEEQLRERIASLIEDINDQRRSARRR